MSDDATLSAPRSLRAGPLALLLACLASAVASAADGDPPGRVAQVNLVEGSGAMQAGGAGDWSSDLLNRPLAAGDRVWIDSGSRAEMHIGSSVLRLGSRTELQVLAVDDRDVHVSVIAGSVVIRVRSFDADESYVLSTPAGDVHIQQPGSYRLDVDDRDRRAFLAVRSGWAEMTGNADSGSLHIDQAAEMFADDTPSIRPVSTRANDSLDRWAEDRDQLEEQSPAAEYVSRDYVGYQQLDGYGDWYTDPVYGPVWVPVVAAGWAPYRYGYWNWINPWGWTWVAAEPWGFAPCHYGRWVQVRHGWAWAPGPRDKQQPVFSPALVRWRHDHPPALYSHGTHAPPAGLAPLRYNEAYVPLPRVVPPVHPAAVPVRPGSATAHPVVIPAPPGVTPVPPTLTPVRPTLTPVRPTLTPVPRPIMRADPPPVRQSPAADRPPPSTRAVNGPSTGVSAGGSTGASTGASSGASTGASAGVSSLAGGGHDAPRVIVRPDRQP
jgi:hypothetical protein